MKLTREELAEYLNFKRAFGNLHLYNKMDNIPPEHSQMRHVILTCKNHPDLRWSCKEIAVTDGKYNGSRNIFFCGVPSGEGMRADGSGLRCTQIRADGRIVQECECLPSDLIIAPEDSLVKRA